ncbi:MAG: Rrf2 family transcriptional regulator [Firmicutes bacterium]|nr:Rrf2 family transcriptional regulator [Bacillota bacterium]
MITNKVEYLLRILLDMSENATEGYISSKDIAERQGIPPKYMPQLMALLTGKGWATSARGARGGVKLAVDPGDINVYDVIAAAGEPLLIKPCLEGKFQCSLKELCPLLPVWHEAQQKLDLVMRQTTLASLKKNMEDVNAKAPESMSRNQ